MEAVSAKCIKNHRLQIAYMLILTWYFLSSSVWTTEKEINFFVERGWSDEITQTLEGAELKNFIPFKRGGGLGVTGSIEADESNPLRTQFKFTTATLDLAKFGSYNLPPVGQGWFDTVYLDDELRVDLNSRNDILVTTAKQ